jgi:linoleoyl-CoA desaturase
MCISIEIPRVKSRGNLGPQSRVVYITQEYSQPKTPLPYYILFCKDANEKMIAIASRSPIIGEQNKIRMSKKIIFQNDPRPFRNTLDKRVKEYFAHNDIAQTGDWRLYTKTVALLVGFALVYLGVVLWSSSALLSVSLFVPLGLLTAMIGFNIMHDGAHGSYSTSDLINTIAARSADICGLSSYLWHEKHNLKHHTYTNVEGADEDIDFGNALRVHKGNPLKWYHKFQYIYGGALYGLTSLNWLLYGDYVKWFSKRNAKKTTQDHLVFWLGKLSNLTIFLFIPIYCIGLHHALLGFAIFHMTLGLTLAYVFQMAHVVEETAFITPSNETEKSIIESEWMVHQVQTTANFAMKSKVINWLVGGLNYQIEHHLYPRISHIHYPKISAIVQQTCKEFNVTYNAFPTYISALRSHFRLLKKMGRVA